MNQGKELVRRSDNAMIAGVCSGLADYLGWDVTNVRILYVSISVLSAAFPGLLIYFILWFVMPKR